MIKNHSVNTVPHIVILNLVIGTKKLYQCQIKLCEMKKYMSEINKTCVFLILFIDWVG